MAYKNNIFKDKTVIALSAISIIAAAALIGGIALDSENDVNSDNNNQIVDLNESDTTINISRRNIEAETEEKTTAPKETKPQPETETIIEETTTPADESVNAPASKLNFTMDSILTWPVDGNIIIDYDMENTVYFPTLNLYKCSDAICIQSDIGIPVYASANCVVNEIGHNEEIGSYVLLDLGNDYSLTMGQLKDIVINPDEVVNAGDLIGYVSEPTDYYSVEGPNLYVKLTENGTPVNPLDYLNYE